MATQAPPRLGPSVTQPTAIRIAPGTQKQKATGPAAKSPRVFTDKRANQSNDRLDFARLDAKFPKSLQGIESPAVFAERFAKVSEADQREVYKALADEGLIDAKKVSFEQYAEGVKSPVAIEVANRILPGIESESKRSGDGTVSKANLLRNIDANVQATQAQVTDKIAA